MRDCGARVLVTSPERLALLRDELEECKSVEHVVLVGQDPSPRAGQAIHGKLLADCYGG